MKSSYFEQVQYSKRNNILKGKGISYQEFLKSNEWKRAKARLYERDGKECSICKSESKLSVHHNKYNEKNLNGSIQALIILCQPCHDELHRVAKPSGWSFKKAFKSLRRRFAKYKSIHFYPPNSSVKYLEKEPVHNSSQIKNKDI